MLWGTYGITWAIGRLDTFPHVRPCPCRQFPANTQGFRYPSPHLLKHRQHRSHLLQVSARTSTVCSSNVTTMLTAVSAHVEPSPAPSPRPDRASPSYLAALSSALRWDPEREETYLQLPSFPELRLVPFREGIEDELVSRCVATAQKGPLRETIRHGVPRYSFPAHLCWKSLPPGLVSQAVQSPEMLAARYCIAAAMSNPRPSLTPIRSSSSITRS